MGAQGHTTVDFGAWPGQASADVAVSGQTGILTSSDAEAWIRCEDSADHSADEHEIEEFDVKAKSIVAGTGFTVVVRPKLGTVYGVWNISWVWS